MTDKDPSRGPNSGASTGDSSESGATTDGGDGPFGQPLYAYGPQERRLVAVTHTLIVLIGALAVGNVLMIGVLDALTAFGITEAETPVAFYSMQMSLSFIAFFLVAGLYLHWRERALIGFRLPTWRDLTVLVGGFILLVGLMVFLEFLIEVLDIETAENVAVERGREHPELFLVLLPIQVLLVAPAEELVFRGIVQGLFRQAYGIAPAILFASAVFALFHVPALGSTGLWPVLAILFVSSCLLGAVYEYTQNLVVPIAIHAAWNILVFGTLYLQASNGFTF